MRRRLRFAVARLLTRIPGTCDTTIWRWANRLKPYGPSLIAGQVCRDGAAEYDWCQCGKLLAPGFKAELGAAVRRHPAGRARGGDRRG